MLGEDDRSVERVGVPWGGGAELKHVGRESPAADLDS